jgi:hypothetical protein
MDLPAVVPTADGGVQLEWHTPKFDIEIDVTSPQEVDMYFQDMTTAAKTEYLDIRDLGALALAARKIGELIDRDGRG